MHQHAYSEDLQSLWECPTCCSASFAKVHQSSQSRSSQVKNFGWSHTLFNFFFFQFFKLNIFRYPFLIRLNSLNPIFVIFLFLAKIMVKLCFIYFQRSSKQPLRRSSLAEIPQSRKTQHLPKPILTSVKFTNKYTLSELAQSA